MTTQDNLRAELDEAYSRLEFQKNILLRIQEECKCAQKECKHTLGQRDAARNQVDLLTRYLDNAMRERDAAKAKLEPLQAHLEKRIKELVEVYSARQKAEGHLEECRRGNQVLRDKIVALEKELHNQKKIAEMRKSEADRLDSTSLASFGASLLNRTATEVLEMQNLKREIERLRKACEVLRNAATSSHTELKAEREAHNKLKALCNERGFGTPLFYTPPTLPKPEPIWEVSFYKNGTHLGDITYNYAPSAKLLNDLQESLKATSWKLIYRG